MNRAPRTCHELGVCHGRSHEVVSICYPQVVNNLVCRALNAAAAVGFPKVDAQVIAGC